MKKTWIVVLGLLLALLLCVLIAGGVYFINRTGVSSKVATAVPSPTLIVQATPTPAPPAVISGEGKDTETSRLVYVYRNVSPSVVYIFVEYPGIEGAGSGFVWDKDGHIVTNNHVVSEGGTTPSLILVTFKDGTRAKAEIVGRDPQSDLAVIKVDVPSGILKPVKTGNSDTLEVGQRVEAIGNPFGYEQGWTMTEGIISALGRTLPTANSPFQIPQVIQTDAAINPGNSGGPLLDDSGRVIGVNSAIKSEVRANAGIGFAIPVNLVKRVVPALITRGKYEHPWVGISAVTLTSDLDKAMDLPADQRGALIVKVISGSPADKAGLRGSSKEVRIFGMTTDVGGDVITAADGHAVNRMSDLMVYLEEHKSPGETVNLTILRNGEQKNVPLVLERRPSRVP